MTGHTDRAEVVLHVENLSVAYHIGRRDREVVSGVDLRLHRGEVLALVGESGSGKSSLAHSLCGLLPHNGKITSGRIVLGEQDISGWSDRRLERIRGRVVGTVPQDPTVSLNPWQRVGTQVAEALRIQLGRDASGQEAVVEALTRAGLPDPAEHLSKYPHELSGGLCQRVLIAIAIASRPPLIIADEPTSALDVTVQRAVLDQLDALVADQGTAVLLITHDLAVAADRADRVIVLQQGRVVEAGAAKAVLADPTHSYTRALVAAAPALRSTRLTPVRAKASTPDPQAPPVLEVRGLVKEFRGQHRGDAQTHHRAVDGVDFTITAGTTLALVGESGSGKTTTARMALRLTAPSAGTINFDGTDITTVTGEQLRSLRRRMQFVYQNPYASLESHMTVAQIVTEPLRAFRLGSRSDRRRRASELIDQVALAATVLNRRPAELSGGQRQRVAIARALALNPAVVALDEPVSALDVSVQAQILQLLVELQAERGLSYLFISHDLAVVRQISDQVAVMHRGRIVESGLTRDVLEHPEHPYTRTLLDAIPGRTSRTDRSVPEPATSLEGTPS